MMQLAKATYIRSLSGMIKKLSCNPTYSYPYSKVFWIKCKIKESFSIFGLIILTKVKSLFDVTSSFINISIINLA